jgi:hypothetical protein
MINLYARDLARAARSFSHTGEILVGAAKYMVNQPV